MSAKIVVAGAAGVLGSAVSEIGNARGYDVFGLGRDVLNVRLPEEVAHTLAQYKPRVIINCAADNDVEGAEEDPTASYDANALLPALLAAAARKQDALIVHFSSTGCFGNWSDRPYTDADRTEPTTVFHKAKAEGDRRVLAETSKALILRTGWIFGGATWHRKNFVWQRLVEARNTDRLFADTSQTGNPTFAGDLAAQTFNLIESGLTGTYNCVGQPAVTRFQYVTEIIRNSGLKCKVEPAPLGYFKRRAPVSPNETAVNEKLKRLGLDTMPDWRDAMTKYVASLAPQL